MRNKINHSNGNARKLFGRRASAVFLTLVLMAMAIVPSFAMAAGELEENANGGGCSL
ncbi:MAG: hypothetical protein LBN34_02005 [Clostridiales Family XIII bacterium]|jgi:hypothetical protein|nr:hypothetical protein [Clostridiales Family XIII bacterium]